jgi:hypothetical protein
MLMSDPCASSRISLHILKAFLCFLQQKWGWFSTNKERLFADAVYFLLTIPVKPMEFRINNRPAEAPHLQVICPKRPTQQYDVGHAK